MAITQQSLRTIEGDLRRAEQSLAAVGRKMQRLTNNSSIPSEVGDCLHEMNVYITNVRSAVGSLCRAHAEEARSGR